MIYVGIPINYTAKNIATNGCGLLLTDVCQKHTTCGSDFMNMDIHIISKKHGHFIMFIDAHNYSLIKGMALGVYKGKRTFYAQIYDRTCKSAIAVHQLIFPTPNGFFADHIDGNGLNNYENNLRLANNSQNQMNKRESRNSKTGFKGLSYIKKKKLWTASIRINGKSVFGGQFKSPLQAAKKYNELAIKYFGEYARLNVITKEIEDADAKIDYRRKVLKTNKTGYRGVSVSKLRNCKKPYIATIYANGKNNGLGWFSTPEEAAKAYNEASIYYFGESAYQNTLP